LLYGDGKTNTYEVDYDDLRADVNSSIVKTQQNKIKEELLEYSGKDGYILNVGVHPFGKNSAGLTVNHAYSIKRVENGKVYLENPYDTKYEIAVPIEEFIKNCGYWSVSGSNK